MKCVLIMILQYSNAVTQEFNTDQACQAAKQYVTSLTPNIRAECFPKGSEPVMK